MSFPPNGGFWLPHKYSTVLGAAQDYSGVLAPHGYTPDKLSLEVVTQLLNRWGVVLVSRLAEYDWSGGDGAAP